MLIKIKKAGGNRFLDLVSYLTSRSSIIPTSGLIKIKRTNWCLLLYFLSSFTLHAQLSGTVTDADTGEPVEGVEVFLPAVEKSALTDEKGAYIINNLSAEDYRVLVFLYAYETIDDTISVNGSLQQNFQIKSLNVNLNEVVVREEEEKTYALKRLRAVEGTAIYAGKKNEVILLNQLTVNAAANNARQIYAQVSGLNIQEANDAGLQLNIGGRGLDPNRSASFNTRQNGYDISADVLGYPESYYSPPAEALSEIQIIRGAASLQYGTQFGGLVNFKFKEPDPNKKIAVLTRQTVGSYGLLTSFNSLSGTVGKFSYYTYYNYKQGDGFRANGAFTSHNFFTHLGYQLSPNTKLTAELTYLDYLAQQSGGITDAQFYNDPTFSNRTRNWFEVDWLMYALRLEHKFSVKTNASVQFFGLDAARRAVGFRTNRVSQVDDLNAARDLLIGEFNNWGLEARLLHRYQLGEKRAVFLIGSKYYDSQNTAIQGPGTSEQTANFNLANEQFPNYDAESNFTFPNRNLAFFIENIFYLTERLSLTPGLRYDYIHTQSEGTYRSIDRDLAGNPIRDSLFVENRDFPRNVFLAGLGLSYKPQPELEWYLNFSQNFRSVTFSDIRVVNPSDQVDPNISDERGFTADVGIRGRRDKLSFEVNAFTLLYDDRLGQVLRPRTRITAEGTTVEVNGTPIRWRGNIGKAFIYGLESLVDWNLIGTFKKTASAFKLNYYLNLALTQSEYLDSEIANITGKQVEFIPLVNLKTGFRFGYKNLLGSIQYTHLSEQFTDATNAPQDRQDNISGIIGAIPAYGILDLSLSYRFSDWLKLEGGVNNVMDNSYFTRRTTGYPGPGIIPSTDRTFYFTVEFGF